MFYSQGAYLLRTKTYSLSNHSTPFLELAQLCHALLFVIVQQYLLITSTLELLKSFNFEYYCRPFSSILSDLDSLLMNHFEIFVSHIASFYIFVGYDNVVSNLFPRGSSKDFVDFVKNRVAACNMSLVSWSIAIWSAVRWSVPPFPAMTTALCLLSHP